MKINELKDKLLSEKSNLEQQIQGLSKGLDFGSDVDHFEQETDEAEEFSNRIDVKQTLEERLKGINIALVKIEKGEYGNCEKCQQSIEPELLTVNPESKFCKNCKKPTND